MIFQNSKYSKLAALTAFLSIAHLLFNSSIVTAEVKGKKKRLPVKVQTLSPAKNSAKKQVISPYLSQAKGFIPQATQKLRPQNNFRLSKIKQTIPVRDQLLLANSVDGNASWYGPGFDGRLTANGETYDQQEMTAAHPSLAFGTRVKVTNLQNGRSVVVRINDRGPFIRDRIIDLSAAAANALNMISSGVAPVRLTILGQ